MKIQNLFTSGKMNKDLDERLIPQGEYRDALNVKVANSTGSDVGAIENALSNQLETSLDLGTNATTIGAISDDEDRVIYWFVKSDTGSFVCYYDQKDDTSGFVLKDTRLLTNENPKNSVLNFSKSHLVQANILTDADNLKKFLYFTDGYNPPRRVNIATAKTYDENGFGHDQINVIVKPPISGPEIDLKTTDDFTENNMEEKFLLFAYRYVYNDGEKSALSPFSRLAFQPRGLNYDFTSAANNSMVNGANAVDITYNTGSSLVKDVEIVFKESGNNNIYLAANIDKKAKGYSNDSEQVYTFKNNSIYKVLPEDEIYRLYDNVPKTAKTQEIINNRLVYGNYTENYNLIDADGNDVIPSITASYVSTSTDEDLGSATARTNRDYEIGIAYLDEYGRSTTVLTSEGNSVNIPNKDSIYQNTLVATIDSVAPSFAKYYRFYIKQSHEDDYDTLSPFIFHEDGEYVWIRLEGDDKNKISGKDYLVVKADTTGIKQNTVKLKILDQGAKERNFLEDSSYTGPVAQDSGYYIKVSAFSAILGDINYRSHTATDNDDTSTSTNNNYTGETTTYLEGPHFYSGVGTQDDMSVSGTYSGLNDVRYEVRISDTGTTDQFKWRAWYVGSDKGAFVDPAVNCSTSPISLNNGLSISFASVTGHNVGDTWTFNAKTDLTANGFDTPSEYAYIALNGQPVATENLTPGSKITFFYKEFWGKNSKDVNITINEPFYSSGSYDNVEEWFWEEGKDQLIENGLDIKENVRFRRGQYTEGSPFAITGSSSDPLCMLIKSDARQLNQIVDRRAYIESSWSFFVRDREDYVIFETVPTKENADVYYEIPGTYEVNDCGYHQGITAEDTNQSLNVPAVINLNFENAYAFGNGFESYKIRDAFVADKMSIKNRPLTYVENYRENNRESSLTYSDVYEQSTNYNGLNEFNLAKVNYTDLDDEYGSIEKIHSRDTNLVVFQENKVSYLPYQKSILYNADGTGNVAQSLNVFGGQVPYTGEYGISNSPHSFSTWGTRVYFADERRGAIMRLSQDGLTEISQFGMRDWFRDNVTATDNRTVIGGYDPFNGQYVVSIKNPVEEWRPDEYECDQASCDIEAVIYEGETTTTTTTTTAAPGPTTTTTTLNPYRSFTFYGPGWSSSGLACAGTGSAITVYVPSTSESTTLYEAYQDGQVLYSDTSLTVPYIGQNFYFKTDAASNVGTALQITSGGVITDWQDCLPTTEPPPTGSYNLFFCNPAGVGAALKVLDDGNIDPGMIIKHQGICYVVDTYSTSTQGFSDYEDFSDCQECQDSL